MVNSREDKYQDFNLVQFNDYIYKTASEQEKSQAAHFLHSAPESVRHMQLALPEARILAFFITLLRPKLILEIGTLVGYSAVKIAQAAPDTSRLISIEKNPEHCAIARQNIAHLGLQHKIDVYEGTALTVLQELAANKLYFDAIFIDGQKSEYPLYLDFAEQFLNSGGILVADNTLLFGSIYRYKHADEINDSKLKLMWQNMKEFNERIAKNSNFSSIILPTCDGLTIALRH